MAQGTQIRHTLTVQMLLQYLYIICYYAPGLIIAALHITPSFVFYIIVLCYPDYYQGRLETLLVQGMSHQN